MRSVLCVVVFFFFFKQKTAYEMRISDWSSDVCSSDLPLLATHLLMPDLTDFARLHPDIEMEILSSGELANLTNREADVALRVVYDRKTLPLNLYGLKGPELFGGVYISCDRQIGRAHV